MSRLRFALLAAVLAWPAGAQAVVVTFDDIPNTGNSIRSTPVVSFGFSFVSAHYHILDTPGLCTGGCVSDGSQYLAADAPNLAFPVAMTSVGGDPFSLTSLDGAKLWLTPGGLPGFENARTLEVEGTFMGGGSIHASFLLPAEGSFSSFLFPAGWDNLASVVFSGDLPGLTNNASWAVDNINATAGPVIPEPTTSLLLGAGLCALGRRYRQRKAS